MQDITRRGFLGLALSGAAVAAGALAGCTPNAAQTGSAGKAAAEENDLSFTPVLDQATALMEVASGTCDAAIIDSLMAAAMVGEGTSYENLTYTVSLTTEEYGVGFRKGSDLAAALNDFFVQSYEDGTMQACAEKYGVQAALIEQ